MADDLDELLRRSMKTLDDQVPSGYFEGLPNRTLARLEGSSMQQTTTGTSGSQTPSGVVPPAEADEDSGLHDIRKLASSARERLSSRRISTSPPVDDDVLASSSAGWKAVALPEPAKMVSLPEIAEVDAKATAKAEKASRKSRPSGQIEQPSASSSASLPAVANVTMSDAPALLDASIPSIATPIIGARIAALKPKPKTSGNRAILGVVGLGLAAAAGGVIYVSTQSNDSAQSAKDSSRVRENAAAPLAEPKPAATVTPIAPAVQEIATEGQKEQKDEAPKLEPAVDPSKVDPKPPEDPHAALEPPPPPTIGKVGPAKAKSNPKKGQGKTEKPVGKVAPPPDKDVKPTKDAKPTKPPPVSTKGGKDADPDFDDLLKQAGVDNKKTPTKPKLDKTSLAAADFKNGMNAVRGKAQACYNGTQGTASVKLTVAPSGQVTKVSVSGAFAGTPVAACVEAAVKSASFPPWDGGPQSFGYSYLLSE